MARSLHTYAWNGRKEPKVAIDTQCGLVGLVNITYEGRDDRSTAWRSLVSFEAIEVVFRPPTPVYSVIFTRGLPMPPRHGISSAEVPLLGARYPGKFAVLALDPPKHLST